MFYKINECVYFKKDKYTFKEQVILDSEYTHLIYCFVVIDDDAVYGLLEGFQNPTDDQKDKAVKNYLKNKRRLISFEYAKAKTIKI